VKTQKEILRWLRDNGQNCGAMTSSDAVALVCSVNLSNLISYPAAPPDLFTAYKTIVLSMQPHTRSLAFHAIAAELDWGHRDMIWSQCGLPDCDRPKIKCAFEPGGSRR